MYQPVIRAVALSKQYRISRRQSSQYRTLRDTVGQLISAPFRRAYQAMQGNACAASTEAGEVIQALHGIHLEVQPGEVLGIIGHNGAGKSTLLKILARITEPTAGYVDIYGRVGSLLEVGTGFHQELTGRENIYLNGSILGMSRIDIARKFDAIVDFSGVEKFIDTPVKHYSSGMHLRLGFSVAAHLEPDILIVDEVLAVGDAEFQKKCLGKMSDVAGEGRTVLFVSHNLKAIRQLCTRGIWLHQGIIAEQGAIDRVTSAYLRRIQNTAEHQQNAITLNLSMLDAESKQPIEAWHLNQTIIIQVTVTFTEPMVYPVVDVAGHDVLSDAWLFSLQSDTFSVGEQLSQVTKAVFEFSITNTSIAVPEIYFNIGVRARAVERYIALFRYIHYLPVTLANRQHHSRAPALLHLPTSLTVTRIE